MHQPTHMSQPDRPLCASAGADMAGGASIGSFRLNPVLLAAGGGSGQSSNPLALDSLYADPVGAAPHRAAEACARAELRAWQQQNPGQAKPAGAGRAEAGVAPSATAAGASGLLHPAAADGSNTGSAWAPAGQGQLAGTQPAAAQESCAGTAPPPAAVSGLLAHAGATSTAGSDVGCVPASLEDALPEGHTTVGELSRAVVGAVAAQVEEALDRAVQVRSPCEVWHTRSKSRCCSGWLFSSPSQQSCPCSRRRSLLP